MKRVQTGAGGLMKGGIWVVEDEILRCAQNDKGGGWYFLSGWGLPCLLVGVGGVDLGWGFAVHFLGERPGFEAGQIYE